MRTTFGGTGELRERREGDVGLGLVVEAGLINQFLFRRGILGERVPNQRLWSIFTENNAC